MKYFARRTRANERKRKFWSPLTLKKEEFRHRENEDLYENEGSEKMTHTHFGREEFDSSIT